MSARPNMWEQEPVNQKAKIPAVPVEVMKMLMNRMATKKTPTYNMMAKQMENPEMQSLMTVMMNCRIWMGSNPIPIMFLRR